MLKYLKKLIKTDYVVSDDIENHELISKVYTVLDHKERLEVVLNDPFNKLNMLSTYTNSIHDLEDNLLNIGNRNLIAVPLIMFLRNDIDNFISFLERIDIILKGSKVPNRILHDLTELLDTILDMLGVEI